MRHAGRLARVGFLLAALAGLAGGCSKKITIYRRPAWVPAIRSVAVVPFRNSAGVQGAGRVVSDQLAAALAGNPAYKRVYNRADFKHIVDERKLRASFTNNPSAVEPFQRWGKADAILVGSVQQYTATNRNERKTKPRMAYNPRTKQTYFTGAYDTWIHTRNESNVSATAALIRVSDGKTIYATHGPVLGRAWSESGYGGSAPQYDPYACRTAATIQVVQKLLNAFGIVAVEIKVKAGKDFFLATGSPFDGEWPKQDTFRATDQKMLVVLRLPPVCDRHKFRIAVARKGADRNLMEVELAWSASFPAVGKSIELNPSAIAAQGGGPGEYEIKLYAGPPEPVLTEDFEILP